MSRVLELEAEEELESFYGVVSSIDEVTHKDVASIGDLTTLIK